MNTFDHPPHNKGRACERSILVGRFDGYAQRERGGDCTGCFLVDGSWEAHVRPFISRLSTENEYSRWSVEFGGGSRGWNSKLRSSSFVYFALCWRLMHCCNLWDCSYFLHLKCLVTFEASFMKKIWKSERWKQSLSSLVTINVLKVCQPFEWVFGSVGKVSFRFREIWAHSR